MSLDRIAEGSATPLLERTIAVLKKTRDVDQATADSLTALIKSAGPRAPHMIDVYA